MATIGNAESTTMLDAVQETVHDHLCSGSIKMKTSNIDPRIEEAGAPSCLTSTTHSIPEESPADNASTSTATDLSARNETTQPCHGCRINASNNKPTHCQVEAMPTASLPTSDKPALPARMTVRTLTFGNPTRPRNVPAQTSPAGPETSVAGWHVVPAKSSATTAQTAPRIASYLTTVRCQACRRRIALDSTDCSFCGALRTRATELPSAAAAALATHEAKPKTQPKPSPAQLLIPTLILTTPQGDVIPYPLFPPGRPAGSDPRAPRLVNFSCRRAHLRVPSTCFDMRQRVKAGFCDSCAVYRCARHWRHSRAYKDLTATSTEGRARGVVVRWEEDPVEVGAGDAVKGGYRNGEKWLRMRARVPRRGGSARGIRINGMWYYEDVARAA
ncbi:hypothetical protein ACHAQA_004900 [Verticillium albo-atrum]